MSDAQPERRGIPAAAQRNAWLSGAWLRRERDAIAARGELAPPLLEREAGDTHEEARHIAAGGIQPTPFDDTDATPSYAGLALSGGGIRSASVCLGVLQALDRHQLLGTFGWLSTVSGGGYTGLGWLAQARAARMRRNLTGPAPTTFPFRLPEDPDGPLRHLRDHASYLLAPGAGPALQAGGMLLRKLLVNLFLLAPVILVLTAAVGGLNIVWRSLEPTPLVLALPWVLLAALVIAAAIALRRESAAGVAAPPLRFALDRRAGFVLAALAALAAALILGSAPEWMAAARRWIASTLFSALDKGVPRGLAGLVTAIFGLLGAGTVASRMRGRFATIALAVIGLLFLFLLIAMAARLWIAAGGTVEGAGYGPRLAWFAILGVGGLAALWATARIVDANALSMHGFYRDRLAEAFFPDGPAPRLSDLLPVETDAPLPIVNATVAGASGPGMARRGRPAGPFSFTPLEFGSAALHYRATPGLELMQPECDAATAMAISAAAVAPQAGRVTGGRVAIFFKALLNARTGRWLPSPLTTGRGGPAPRADGHYAFREMAAGLLRRADDPLVLVSDGGHWENLGVLSLIHRHCPLVLAIDAEADPDMAFNGLGIATMLSRLDAGTELRLDTRPLKPGRKKPSQSHFRWGHLYYPGGRNGTLLYVKSTLTGDEPPDVLHYAARNPAFPHETTADQFFSEDQFEAYRALGEHIGDEVATALRGELQRRGVAVPPAVPPRPAPP